MRDVNHVARSRSHHRQRQEPVRPARRPTSSGSHRPTRGRVDVYRSPASRPSASRSSRSQRSRGTAAKHDSVASLTTRGRPAPHTRRRARVDNRSNGQAFRKRAVVPHHARVYRAGQSSRRLVAVFVIAALLFIAVLARVTVLQTVQADALRTAGKTQRTTEQVLRAHRGTIFDRTGADLALSVPARTVIANPKLVVDPAGTVRTLTALLQLPVAKQRALTEAFTAKKNSFVYVVRQIDPVLANTVVALRLAGISSISEDQRCCRVATSGGALSGAPTPTSKELPDWRRSTTPRCRASTANSRRSTTASSDRSPEVTRPLHRSPAPTSS